MYTQNEKRYYWGKKEEKARQAKVHTEQVELKYSPRVKLSVEHSVVYDNSSKFSAFEDHGYETVFELSDNDSVTAVEEAVKEFNSGETIHNITALNFASYKFPGGGFLLGSIAQEECLCHESTLFNVISDPKFANYYEWNRQHLNKALYLNRAILSPDILFKEKFEANVLTCAAPNFTTADKYNAVSREENTKVLIDRIRFVLNCCRDYGSHVLVLGAYGAGVFGQDGEEVADIFTDLLLGEFKNSFMKVIFAVPKSKGKAENYDKFEKVLKEKNLI